MCQFVQCANGGECYETDTLQCFACHCKVGFTGTTCETKEDIMNTSEQFI